MIEKLEYWWRHRIVYPILSKIFRNTEIKTPIDILAVKSILFLRYDRIGDMIVTTPIFKSLKDANPKIIIGVLASQTNAEIIRHNPYIDKIHILPKHWWQLWWEITKIQKNQYDIVLNLVFNRTTSGGILSNLIAPKGIKVGQGDEKYRFFFNRLHTVARDNKQMVDIIASYLKEGVGLDIPSSNRHYEIFIDDATRKRVMSFLEDNKLRSRKTQTSGYLPYIVFNLSASDKWTRFSTEQVQDIVIFLGSKTTFRSVVICAPSDYEMLAVARNNDALANCFSFPRQGNATLLELAALIEGAQCVISPDTSTIHFASAMCTPVLGFYTSAKEKLEWLPYQVKNKIVMSESNKPASSIPIPIMIEAIDEFLYEL